MTGEEIWAWLSVILVPSTVTHIFIYGALVYTGFILIMRGLYVRDPIGGRIGDYEMTVLHGPELEEWKCTLFKLNPGVYSALEKQFEMHGTPEVGEAIKKNQGKLSYFAGRHMPMEGGTINHGWSIIATNADLDNSVFYRQIQDHFNYFKGLPSRTRKLAPSGPLGIVLPDKSDRIDEIKHEANLIFYDAQPIEKNSSLQPAQIEFLQVHLESIAYLKTWNKTAREEENKNVIIKELQSAKKNAVGRAATMQAHYNESEWARFNKRPDSIQGMIQQAGINPYAAAGGMGMLMLMVMMALKDKTTQFDPLFWGMLALGIGLGGLYIASKLMGGKPR